MSKDALPEIPVHDYRNRSLLDFATDGADGARRVMETVLKGFGSGRHFLRPILPVADRVARRRLQKMRDPYLDEILAIRRAVGVPGPVAFSLSYEFGCTARVFETGACPTLFRTLDWPFRGLGELVEIVMLPGREGPWITATWPGVVGVLHGAAPGRFAAALNQAPERQTKLGRGADWLASKRRFFASHGLPPAHLLRMVFETAPDFSSAQEMLTETPLAAPAIFTLAGTEADQGCTIERTETAARVTTAPAAANHFETALEPGAAWRARGYDSQGRRADILAANMPPDPEAIPKPILNELTRLAVIARADGTLSVVGYDADRQVTRRTDAAL